MCGRFTLTVDPQTLQEHFPGLVTPSVITPRYNIAPSQPVAVIANDGRYQLDFFTWGLIPAWAKDPSIGNKMINARAETLVEKPSFRNAFRRRRCLVLADGFYEWKVVPGERRKIPTYIRMQSGHPFAFAGLWENWHAPDGSQVYSCTIITTEPNALLATIHNRMPVILPPDQHPAWLAPEEASPANLQPLLSPYPPEQMIAYAVSTLVNSPDNDEPACVQPVH